MDPNELDSVSFVFVIGVWDARKNKRSLTCFRGAVSVFHFSKSSFSGFGLCDSPWMYVDFDTFFFHGILVLFYGL